MVSFSVGEGRLYLSNANDKCRPHSCLYIYIYIYRKKKTFTVNIKNLLIFENGPHMVPGRSPEISLRYRRNFC